MAKVLEKKIPFCPLRKDDKNLLFHAVLSVFLLPSKMHQTHNMQIRLHQLCVISAMDRREGVRRAWKNVFPRFLSAHVWRCEGCILAD